MADWSRNPSEEPEPGTPQGVSVQFPTTPLRAASVAAQRASLHPSLLNPLAYYCHQCERRYDRPPIDVMDADSGALMKRLCASCRCEAIECIESEQQSRALDAQASSAAQRRATAAQRLVQNQPVTMRIVEQLPNGVTVTRVFQSQVPFAAGADRMGNLHEALGPLLGALPMAAFGATGGGGAGDAGLDTLLARLFEDAQASFEGRGAPAPAEVVANLRRFVPSSQDAAQSACTVCMDTPEGDDRCVELPCGHQFHEDCMLPWLRAHDTCPVCRKRLVASTDENAAGSPGSDSH